MTDNPSQQLKVIYQVAEHLLANPRNARTHSKQQIRKIAESIQTFGFSNPVLVDRNNMIVAGHGRVQAAKLLEMDEVPTIRLDTLTGDQLRAYVLADNKLAQKAGWDESILAIELRHLTVNSDIDVTITGFEMGEVDLIVSQATEEPDRDDLVDIDQTQQTVTQSGDLWQLGRHRLLCGNSLEEESYKTLMAGRRAGVVFVDPPFNVRIPGHASGNGAVQHRDFAMASGEMNEAEFVAFLTTSFRLLSRYSDSGSAHFACIDWRHMTELLSAGRQIYDELLNLCIWSKNNGGMGSLYRSAHELIFVFRNGKGRHRNNVKLGQFGRNRTNVWNYPNANTFSKQGDEGNLLAVHPTVKPVALVADAILDVSARGDIVLDSFLGSGTTLIAAERVGRICFGIELDPLYVDVTIRRWQKHTGDRAIHAATGKSFDDLAASSEVQRG